MPKNPDELTEEQAEINARIVSDIFNIAFPSKIIAS